MIHSFILFISSVHIFIEFYYRLNTSSVFYSTDHNILTNNKLIYFFFEIDRYIFHTVIEMIISNHIH